LTPFDKDAVETFERFILALNGAIYRDDRPVLA